MINQQISISKARNNLALLVKEIKTRKELYLVKNYKPQAALVDIDYLIELKRQAHAHIFNSLFKVADNEVNLLLKNKGLNPDTISENEINTLFEVENERMPI